MIPFLANVNNPKLDADYFKDAAFFVIRSKSFRDVHKSMKYGVWTSSKYNNYKFNTAFRQHGGKVFFIYTTLQHNFFLGIAQMYAPVNPNKEFAYWGELGRWRGLCFVHWILVREVPFEMISDLKEDGEVLFNLKDGSAVSFRNAFNLIQ